VHLSCLSLHIHSELPVSISQITCFTIGRTQIWSLFLIINHTYRLGAYLNVPCRKIRNWWQGKGLPSPHSRRIHMTHAPTHVITQKHCKLQKHCNTLLTLCTKTLCYDMRLVPGAKTLQHTPHSRRIDMTNAVAHVCHNTWLDRLWADHRCPKNLNPEPEKPQIT